MEKVTYSPKDAKIIKDNQGKSPYELQALGLSAKGFEKYMAQQSTGSEPIADPTITDEGEEKPPVPGDDPYAYQEPPEEPQEELENDQDLKEEKPPVPFETAIPLVPKITQIKQPQTPVSAVKLLRNQVLVQTPTGKTNPMGREFAEKLVKMDPKYKIIR